MEDTAELGTRHFRVSEPAGVVKRGGYGGSWWWPYRFQVHYGGERTGQLLATRSTPTVFLHPFGTASSEVL